MGTDEVGTLATLKAHRAVTDPISEKHGGRIVGAAGDGLLLEFPSVVAAVSFAVETQGVMAKRNADIPDDQKMLYRVGINLGDVLVDGEDIYGDGVNVAARLEALAEPGGICVSRAVHDNVRDKMDIAFGDMGEVEVKNIARPVHVWRWIAEGQAVALPARAGGPLPLPDKPSIAVLPFDNMSGDPEQEFLADGLSEDIITALSKLSDMFVIARNSTFAYKGMSPDVRKVAEELGVRTVLEGSVRRSGDRVRITAQLIEAKTGRHIWAERFDRQITDIFDLQDEITQEIVTALEARLTKGEQARLRRRQTNNFEAWDLYVRALASFNHFTREDNVMARELIQRAIQLDPKFAAAWVLQAFTHLNDARLSWGESNAISREKGIEAALQGLAINKNEADAHAMLGYFRVLERRYDEATEAGRRAIELAPSAADNYVFLAGTLNFMGRAEEAVNLIQKAMRLSPFYPEYYLGLIGVGYRLLGRYDEAIAVDMERLERNPDNAYSDLRLAAVYSELGRDDEARFHVREALRKNSNFSLTQVRHSDPYQDDAEMEHYLNLLRKAGLPE
jgi:TolB-like protein